MPKFKAIDTNGAGELQQEELASLQTKASDEEKNHATALFHAHDADGCKGLSEDEFSKAADAGGYGYRVGGDARGPSCARRAGSGGAARAPQCASCPAADRHVRSLTGCVGASWAASWAAVVASWAVIWKNG